MENFKKKSILMWIVLLIVYTLYLAVVEIILGVGASDVWDDMKEWFKKRM
ncbi:MAG: hypothetical protein Q4D16_26085 [Eubacteriales bacterium]|nr:hypothetical protein [Eubacteriales bacterium]